MLTSFFLPQLPSLGLAFFREAVCFSFAVAKIEQILNTNQIFPRKSRENTLTSCIHFPINKELTWGEKIFTLMKKMSPFPHERKEAEGGEDSFSEEKAPKSPALAPQTYIAPQSDQYRSQGRAIEVEARSNRAWRAEQYCFERSLQKKRPPPPKGKGEADGCIYLYIIGEVRASGRSSDEWAKGLSSGWRCGVLVSDTLCDQRSRSQDSAPPRQASAHHDASWPRSKRQQCLQT